MTAHAPGVRSPRWCSRSTRRAGARVRVLAARADDRPGLPAPRVPARRARPVPRPAALITQTLALRIFDIGDLAAARRRSHLPERGLRISWQSYLRVDHDFGDYTSGRVTLAGPVRRDAIDVIPELADSVARLDLLYGYVQLDGLADDRLERAARPHARRRRLEHERRSTAARRATALAGAGRRVRDGGAARARALAARRRAYELDGTSGAGCRSTSRARRRAPATWQLIDRNRAITNNRLTSDYEYCPQRDVHQPTIGVAIATIATSRLCGAELGYRRTWTETVGLIDTGRSARLPRPRAVSRRGRPGAGDRRRRGAAVRARARASCTRGTSASRPYGERAVLAAPRRVRPRRCRRARAARRPRARAGGRVLPARRSTATRSSTRSRSSRRPTFASATSTRGGPWRGTRRPAWLRRYAHEDGTSLGRRWQRRRLEQPFGARLARARRCAVGRRLRRASRRRQRRGRLARRGRRVAARPGDRARRAQAEDRSPRSSPSSAVIERDLAARRRRSASTGSSRLDNDEIHDLQTPRDRASSISPSHPNHESRSAISRSSRSSPASARRWRRTGRRSCIRRSGCRWCSRTGSTSRAARPARRAIPRRRPRARPSTT